MVIFWNKVIATISDGRSKQDNVAGVKLPRFEHFIDSSSGATGGNDLTGLARGGQQIQGCRVAHLKAIELLVELASLQTSFLTLDDAIKTTNRRYVTIISFIFLV